MYDKWRTLSVNIYNLICLPFKEVFMRKIWIFLLLTFCFLMTSCQQAVEEEGEEEMVERGETMVVITTEEEELVELNAPDILPHSLVFDTLDYASIGFKLAKGEVFSARMHIWKYTAVEREKGDLIFWILDPNRHRIFDAGRIEGTYEFTLKSNRSGTYILTFDDEYGYRTVELNHDYDGDIWDYSR